MSLLPYDLLLLATPVVAAALVMVAPSRRVANSAAVAGGVVSAVLVLLLLSEVLSGGSVREPYGLLAVDALSGVLLLLLAIVGLASVVYSVDYLGWEDSPHPVSLERLRRYHTFVLLFLFTMFLVAEANNLGLLWIAVEGTTLCSALLVGFYHTKRAVEASWKYLVLCTVGLVFALFGTLLLYLASEASVGPAGASLDWNVLITLAPKLDPGLVRLALVFLFIGYGTKAGFAPLHVWLPDAHSEAPTPVSALLSAGLLKCAVYALLRVDAITVRMPGFSFATWLFLGFGLLSVLLAALFILVQRDLKRLLAYHSVEHMGIISIGIGFGGFLGLFGALFHMINHAATKATLFLAGGNLSASAHTKDLEEVSGALTALPATGTVLLVGGLALAGVPPFSVFTSEFLILTAGFASGDWAASALLLLALAIVFGGLMMHLMRALLGARPHQGFSTVPRRFLATALALGLLFPIVVGLGLLLPSPLSELLRQAVKVVNG
ncbi:MAG: hydrogenase 4 subunit F [Euryarchaeota archaeon]|nr:hydrogenase 4 subunit F [Euryarchaeota archaeon]MDE1837603.1 hydrogenase 4 subunit F [Euryarchaeota archaeon]MDE1881256.1 hydrogenase 4 subunit F [Euryarchaeota archaeon]MDE2045914.1 hydrogenase 4 subunit F [Thermoplasmata archaeon]